jgi:hypothetical protein
VLLKGFTGLGGVGKDLDGLLAIEKGKGEEMGLAAIAGPDQLWRVQLRFTEAR